MLAGVSELEFEFFKECFIFEFVDVRAPHVCELKKSAEQFGLVDEVIGLRYVLLALARVGCL